MKVLVRASGRYYYPDVSIAEIYAKAFGREGVWQSLTGRRSRSPEALASLLGRTRPQLLKKLVMQGV